jgi:hypothetical protein
MTRVFEKSVVTNFPLHEIDVRATTHQSSATNGHSRTQPSYGMQMNSYAKQPQPPPLFWDKPTVLRTARPSGPDLGLSGPPAGVHDLYGEPLRAVPGPSYSSQGLIDMLGSSEYGGPSVLYTESSDEECVKQDAGYYMQSFYPPQQ